MKNKTIELYALFGLSEPVLKDDVTGKTVSFKLNESERKAILDGISKSSFAELINDAEDYFREEDNVFYKNSRWTSSAILHHVNVQKMLTQCRNRYSVETVN